MLIGLLSDAHGNALGLRRCLDALARLGVDRMYYLGDAVGYLPGEADVLRLLGERQVMCQQGNHEAMLLGHLPLDPRKDDAYRLSAARRRLPLAVLRAIERWPTRREFEVDSRRLLLVHGAPWDDLSGYVYADSDLSAFSNVPYDAVCMGNTHRPFVTRVASTAVINVGSCGLPRDQGDLPSFAVYDTADNACRILRVRVAPEDVLRAAGDPPVHNTVLACLRRTTASAFGTVVTST